MYLPYLSSSVAESDNMAMSILTAAGFEVELFNETTVTDSMVDSWPRYALGRGCSDVLPARITQAGGSGKKVLLLNRNLADNLRLTNNTFGSASSLTTMYARPEANGILSPAGYVPLMSPAGTLLFCQETIAPGAVRLLNVDPNGFPNEVYSLYVPKGAALNGSTASEIVSFFSWPTSADTPKLSSEYKDWLVDIAVFTFGDPATVPPEEPEPVVIDLVTYDFTTLFPSFQATAVTGGKVVRNDDLDASTSSPGYVSDPVQRLGGTAGGNVKYTFTPEAGKTLHATSIRLSAAKGGSSTRGMFWEYSLDGGTTWVEFFRVANIPTQRPTLTPYEMPLDVEAAGPIMVRGFAIIAQSFETVEYDNLTLTGYVVGVTEPPVEPEEPADPVTELTATKVGEDGINLQWKANPDAIAFRITDNNGFSAVVPASTTAVAGVSGEGAGTIGTVTGGGTGAVKVTGTGAGAIGSVTGEGISGSPAEGGGSIGSVTGGGTGAVTVEGTSTEASVGEVSGTGSATSSISGGGTGTLGEVEGSGEAYDVVVPSRLHWRDKGIITVSYGEAEVVGLSLGNLQVWP